MAIQGIDVSSSQGTIHWDRVKGNGIEFVYIKATEGLQHDPNHEARVAYLRSNWPKIGQQGLLRGAYHFFRADMDSELQADVFLQTIADLDDADLPPMLDVETSDQTSNDLIQLRVQRFLTKIEEETGTKPVIYTYASFWNEHLNNKFGGYPLWIAAYGPDKPTGPTVPKRKPTLPRGWTDWTFWQYASKGKVDGIATIVDLDLFKGTLEELKNL